VQSCDLKLHTMPPCFGSKSSWCLIWSCTGERSGSKHHGRSLSSLAPLGLGLDPERHSKSISIMTLQFMSTEDNECDA
jgi:hypothetical protein